MNSTVEWALSLFSAARATKGKKTRPAPRKKTAAALLVERFALDPLELGVVELAWAAECSAKVAAAARALAGGPARGLTVEVASALLGDAVGAALHPGRSLRRHALVRVCGSDGPTAPPSFIDELRCGLGLAARLLGGPDPEMLARGVRMVAADGPFAELHPPSPRVISLVRSEPASGEHRVCTLDGCGRRESLSVAVALARFGGRKVIVADGEALLAQGAGWDTLLALRREADLDGHALLILQSAALGESWRALAAPPPAQPLAPSLILLTDAVRVRELTMLEGLRAVSLVLPVLATALPPGDQRALPREDGFDQIRQLAVRDAERALGIVRAAPPPPAPANANANANANVAAPVEAPPVAAPKPRRSKKAQAHFGDPETQPAAIAPVAPPPVEKPAERTISGPQLDVPADAGPEVLARICSVSPNPEQRIELIGRLAGFKSSTVVAALRANARSEHAGVRAAAESAMAALFGPDWNRTRAVPKPVQPPRSDDNDRGPPGGL